jgi:hypothetical protein
MVGSNVPSFQQAIHRLQVAEFPPLMYWFFLSLDLQACYTCFLSCFFEHCGCNLQVTADCRLWIFKHFYTCFFFFLSSSSNSCWNLQIVQQIVISGSSSLYSGLVC